MKKFSGAFDKTKIKQFFILNVEKLAFGLSMICVAGLCYAAMRSQPYDKQPADIEAGITRAKKTIADGKIDLIEEGVTPPKYDAMAKRAGEAVPSAPFTWKEIWTDPSRKIGTKRSDPAFLPVKDLVASAGVGAFAFFDPDAGLAAPNPAALAGEGGPGVPVGEGGLRGIPPGRAQAQPAPGGKRPATTRGKKPGGLDLFDDAAQLPGEGAAPGFQGGEGLGAGFGGVDGGQSSVSAPADSLVKGVQWVCITGLVPYKEQVQKYLAEFEKAEYIDPLLDEPGYAGYLVERAEVPEGESGDAAKLKWTRLQAKAALKKTEEWAVEAPEVVDQALTLPELTFPLGPLLSRPWGKDVAHPKLPMIDPLQRAQGGEAAGNRAAALLEEEPVRNDLEDFKRRDRANVPGAGNEGGRPTRGSGFRGVGGEGTRGGFRGVGGEGGQGGRRMIAGRGDYAQPDTEGAGYENPLDLIPENLLFRFFDFSVQEGKLYRYRVQLVLWNPNFEVRPRYLKDAKSAVDTVKFSDWCTPSPVISVTSYNTILAGAVKTADKSSEAKANAIVLQFDKNLGVKAVYEARDAKLLPTGKREDKVLPALMRGQLMRFTAKVDVFHPLTQRPEQKDVNFDPNLVLLDLKGGELFALSPKDRDKVPGEMLFLDPNGSLMVKSELEDDLAYRTEVDMMLRMEEARATAAGSGAGYNGEGVPPARRREGQ